MTEKYHASGFDENGEPWMPYPVESEFRNHIENNFQRDGSTLECWSWVWGGQVLHSGCALRLLTEAGIEPNELLVPLTDAEWWIWTGTHISPALAAQQAQVGKIALSMMYAGIEPPTRVSWSPDGSSQSRYNAWSCDAYGCGHPLKCGCGDSRHCIQMY